MIKSFLYFSLLLITACQLPAEKEAEKAAKIRDTFKMQTSDSNTAAIIKEEEVPVLIQQKVKNPQGIYRANLPAENGVEHTVAFYPNHTFQLQEEHAKDSVVIIEGNWLPSNGYIWLYKDQVVRARYSWNGDQLQYFNPSAKKNFSMQHLKDAMQNKTWSNKKEEGIVFFGIGNEPFWSIEVNNTDSISFQLSEWQKPVTMKITSSQNIKDSIVYSGQSDSSSLRLTVLPYFCSDGMSDYVYRNKVSVLYNNHIYNGCGMLYQ